MDSSVALWLVAMSCLYRHEDYLLLAEKGWEMIFDTDSEAERMDAVIAERELRTESFAASINRFAATVHKRSMAAGWWSDAPNIGEKLCLIHSEISEAMEGYRKDSMDDHLPDRKMIEVELADAMIRIGDLAARLNLDLGGAVDAKMEYNLHREDHKLEARRKSGGKRF